MADGKIKISELDEALQLSDNAEFPYSQDNGGVPTTFKAPANQIARKVAEGSTFTNLETTAKTLVGAINELSHLGNPILLGTTAPTSSIGADGNIYVQYTEGTGGADDEVDGIYVKINGAWCEISTGGGSGTTDYEDLSNKPQVNSVELVGNKSLDDLGIMPASLSKTVSGSIAHIEDGADNIPVKTLASEIVAVESGSGTKSPTNPYTISGFSSATIRRDNKNFISLISDTVQANRQTSITINSISDNSINMTSGGLAYACFGRFIYLKAGKYTVSLKATSSDSVNPTATVYKGSTTIVSGINNTTPKTFTASADGIYELRMFATGSGDTTIRTVTFSEIQIETGEDKTTFEAYNGNTYTFAFGQTVYGGHFDNKGNFVVTKIAHIFDGTETFISLESGTVFAYDFGANTLVNSQVAQGKSLSTHFIEVDSGFGWNSVTSGKFLVAGNRYFGCNPNMSLADYKTFLANQYQANTPVKAICLLANPITLAITSQDIPTLLGENNIFSNTGDVEVDYYTDNADEIVEVAKATASTPLHNYSTDEQVVGTWIDGKTLYEKTVIITNAGKDASYDLGITDFDTCFVYDGSFGGNGIIPYLHGTYPDNSIGGFLDDTGSSLAWAFRSGSQVPATISGFITVRYTKSST